ncbi:MAG: hypothetical protein IIA83_00295 [Thaumarchaeota archaeon]|nr:hypothetical protein [Nitrososphaerota archaeon]
MSICVPFRFFDPSQISQGIMWMILGWAFPYGWNKLRLSNIFKISRLAIWRKFQWCTIGLHAISLIACMYIGNFWKFVGLEIVEEQFTRIMVFNLTYGFKIFKKLEPDIAEVILTKLKEWTTKHQ